MALVMARALAESVRFKDGAVEAQERSAAAGIGIGAALDGAQGVLDQQGSKDALGVFGNLVLDPTGHAFGEAFQGLEDNVADKAVADYNVNAVVEEVVALDISDKIQVGHFAEFAGLLGQFGAFIGFGAVAQDAHAGVLVAENFAGINAAHDGEMEKVNGPAFDAGARIQQHEIVFWPRDDGGDAGPVHSRQGAQTNGAGGDNPARVAGGDKGVGQSILEQIDGAQDGAILLAPQAFHRFVLHAENFAGGDDAKAWIAGAGRLDGGFNFLLASDQEELGDGGAGLQSLAHTLNDRLRAVIAAHHIHYNAHKKEGAERESIPRPRKTVRQPL